MSLRDEFKIILSNKKLRRAREICLSTFRNCLMLMKTAKKRKENCKRMKKEYAEWDTDVLSEVSIRQGMLFSVRRYLTLVSRSAS